MLTQKQKTRLTTRILNDNRLDLFTLTGRGKSMRPFIKDGTRIKLRKISPGRPPEIGDVAVIKYRNGLLVHRIILTRGRENDRDYFTKGDRRLVGDGWVPRDRIIGIVDLSVAGRILGRAIVIYSLFLLTVGKILRRDRRKK